MENVWNVFSFLFGAVVGSFLNVCIYRIPEDKSIVTPRSACPQCGHPIRAYDNIPILSYFLLGRKCRDCGASISPRYAVVELLTGLLSLALFLKYGFSLAFAAAFLFSAALIVITFIDLDYQIIPDIITLPAIPFFFLAGVFVFNVSWLDALLGLSIGGGSLYVIAVGYRFFRKQEGMGMGDVKLMAMLGAFFGWKSLIYILFVSSFLGSLIGIAIIIFQKGNMKYAIPYGPFLSVAALSYIFIGQRFMALMFLF